MKQSQFLESFKQFKEGLKKLYWKKNPGWYLQFKRFDDEEFKEIKGYYGLYFISNYGQLVSFRKKFPKLLKPKLESGFLSIRFKLHHGSRSFYIHNLVYETFVGQIKSKRRVIHKNGVNTDNYYKNLRVVMPPPHLRKLVPIRKNAAVLQFDKDGRYLKQYSSIETAAVDTGISLKGLQACLRGISKTSVGYQWRYKDDKAFRKYITNIEPVNYRPSSLIRPVLQFDLKGNFIWEYPSIREAARDLGYHVNRLYNALAMKAITNKEFQWRFKDDPLFAKGIVNIGPAYYGRGKQVLQFTKKGKFIRKYSSITEASREVDISSWVINDCILGKGKTAGGYQWRRAASGKEEPHQKVNDIEPVKYKPSCRERAVLQFDLKGNFIREYRNAAEAERKTNTGYDSIKACVSGKYRSAGNFQWRFRNDPLFKNGIVSIDPLPPPVYARSKAVLQFDLEGNFVKEYPSVGTALREIGAKGACISNCSLGKGKTAAGFQWKYKNDPRFANGIGKIEPLTYPDRSEPVLQFDWQGKFINEFESAAQAARILKLHAETIRCCCRRKNKIYKTFLFRYKRDVHWPGNKKKPPSIDPFKGKIFRKYPPIFQFSLEGKFIAPYSSAREAFEKLGINAMSIRRCLSGKARTTGGFQWRPSDDPLFKNGITGIPPVR